nr:MAG TPA: hypothetical protein [Caudoviricetes sp.]
MHFFTNCTIIFLAYNRTYVLFLYFSEHTFYRRRGYYEQT